LEKKEIVTDFISINEIISCEKDEKRIIKMDKPDLIKIKSAIEKHIKNSYYRDNQVPIVDEEGNSLNAILLTWMEVN
jgi:hypothetical protein